MKKLKYCIWSLGLLIAKNVAGICYHLSMALDPRIWLTFQILIWRWRNNSNLKIIISYSYQCDNYQNRLLVQEFLRIIPQNVHNFFFHENEIIIFRLLMVDRLYKHIIFLIWEWSQHSLIVAIARWFLVDDGKKYSANLHSIFY